MHLSTSVLTTALAATAVTAHPGSRSNRKPLFKGDFTIDQYQLYPENADYDFNSGKLYIGQLWNASLGIYDPYTKEHEVVEFPGISHNPMLNMGGVGVDKRTGLVSLVANGPLEFPTNGANIAGDRWLISYDPKAKKESGQIRQVQPPAEKKAATLTEPTGGFQDVEQDPAGNTLVVGSFPGTLTKVSKNGKTVTPWYLPATINSTNRGIGGIAASGWTLLAYGDASGALWKFDMRAPKGVPAVVPISGNHSFAPSDAIYLPPKYNAKVLLVAESAAGTAVFKSEDSWTTAEYKGTVPLPKLDLGTALVAPVQVGDGIYQVFAYFGDVGLGGRGTAGNRTQFPFYDISEEVDELVGSCGKGKKGAVKREEGEVDSAPAVAAWWYKGHQRREESAPAVAAWWEESAPAVATWWYKGHQRREESAPAVATWWYKGHQRREESAPAVATWWYKGHQRREESVKVAGWWYKSNGQQV
ncbi:hypothetical protein BU23DRAFT_562605 [Bimuria novae-zelandiae CBS 107.79]|uniref:Uncharacterized protein n=1 Tax=Bimuria novae-zelandiae CBS 107.79 TaxID=1447943 RepID=A0A6A5W416_9PLEO|nr:hypothetical protein BU23DRAFT_562605 [Bimuria novae-zelandiae CBS 107.79]